MDFFAKIAPLRVGGFLEVHHISTELSSDCLEASTSKGWIWGINVKSGWTSPMNLTYDIYTSRRNSFKSCHLNMFLPKGTSKGAVQKIRAMAVGSMFVHSEFEEMSAYIKKLKKKQHLLLWVAWCQSSDSRTSQCQINDPKISTFLVSYRVRLQIWEDKDSLDWCENPGS